MAMQTATGIVSASNVSTVYREILESIGFSFASDAPENAYGVRADNGNLMSIYAAENQLAVYAKIYDKSNSELSSFNNMTFPFSGSYKYTYHAVWDENYLVVYIAKGSGFPQAEIGGNDNYGFALVKCRIPDSDSCTWAFRNIRVVSINNDKYFTAAIFGMDAVSMIDPESLMSPATRIVTISHSSRKLLTDYLIGRDLVYPDKVYLIEATPEACISSIGWVDIDGKECYKNGFFLIDVQR